MPKVAHVIGNGDNATLFDHKAKGLRITCNLPPFSVENVWATVMVDFKMMAAITEGSLQIPGEWVLGARPKKWMELRPDFYMRYAAQVKEFYTVLPKYVSNYTDFNCGHMAVHYTANKLKAEEIHMYGFDSLFDFNLRSCSDLYLFSNRDGMNNERLTRNWRPIWLNMFKEFPNTKFVLYHKHNGLKFPQPNNVEIVVRK